MSYLASPWHTTGGSTGCQGEGQQVPVPLLVEVLALQAVTWANCLAAQSLFWPHGQW